MRTFSRRLQDCGTSCSRKDILRGPGMDLWTVLVMGEAGPSLRLRPACQDQVNGHVKIRQMLTGPIWTRAIEVRTSATADRRVCGGGPD